MKRLVVVSLILSASIAGASPVDVQLTGELGGGRVELLGTRYGTVDAGLDLTAGTWLSPTVGIGVRFGSGAGVPVGATSLSREVPWLVEPELRVRTRPSRWSRGVEAGWMASAGIGGARLRTVEPCSAVVARGGGKLPEDHGDGGGDACTKTVESSSALEGSVTAGAYLDAYHVAMFVGVRASGNTGGDLGAGLVAGAGATF